RIAAEQPILVEVDIAEAGHPARSPGRSAAARAAAAHPAAKRPATATVTNQIHFDAIEIEAVLYFLHLGVGEGGAGVAAVVVQVAEVDRRIERAAGDGGTRRGIQAPIDDFQRLPAVAAKAPAGADLKAAVPQATEFGLAEEQRRLERSAIQAGDEAALL